MMSAAITHNAAANRLKQKVTSYAGMDHDSDEASDDGGNARQKRQRSDDESEESGE